MLVVDGLVILAVSRNSFNNNLNYYFDLHLMRLLIHCLVLQDFLTPYLLFLFFPAKDGVWHSQWACTARPAEEIILDTLLFLS